MYPALQFAPDEMAKPDGSLSLPYVAGALRELTMTFVSSTCPWATLKTVLKTRSTTPNTASGLIRCGLAMTDSPAKLLILT